MKYEKLAQFMEGLASDFVFLDQKEIDVPTAGNFLNVLDQVSREAEAIQVGEAVKIAGALSVLLEKIVLLQIGDPGKAYRALEEGITAIQQVVSSYRRWADPKGASTKFYPWSSTPAGTTGSGNSWRAEEGGRRTGGAAGRGGQRASFEIEDEGLLRDFITEGLEYISEIEVNILNLEQNPTDKDCINASSVLSIPSRGWPGSEPLRNPEPGPQPGEPPRQGAERRTGGHPAPHRRGPRRVGHAEVDDRSVEGPAGREGDEAPEH